MRHEWIDSDGIKWLNEQDRVWCWPWGPDEPSVDMGVPDKRDREILRLAERERKLREAAIEFLCKALTVQRLNTPEWMEYIRDAGNSFALSFGIEERAEIDGDRLTLRAR